MREAQRLKFTPEEEDDNAGKEAAEAAENRAEDGARRISQARRRSAQKRRIKKQYAAAKAGRPMRGADGAAGAVGGTAEKARRAAKRAEAYIQRHRGGLATLGLLVLMLVFLLNAASSCSVMLGSFGSAAASCTYASADADLLGAEAEYCAWEEALAASLKNYENTHDYDEYSFDLDEIGHDPYVLLSLLSAMESEAWTLGDVQASLLTLFERQYILSEEVTEETRYRTVTVIGTRTVVDPETGEKTEEEYEYEVEVPYIYRKCTVTLENFNLSHLPVYLLEEDLLGRYAGYMAALGNRPDLFPSSPYVAKYSVGYAPYTIPEELLQDERFAAIIAEAEKYLGYPYVWGGSSPKTSFDCSGFVSWVLDHSGWNVGRMGVDALHSFCTPVSQAEARPGDLVFFSGTYDTPGYSHVGIYVGDHMMLHCGDPISYADLRSDYWQAHLAGYGRLP